ncbi:MAG: polysaccharide deacetylase family protein [Thermoanaerobaculia bacterium]
MISALPLLAAVLLTATPNTGRRVAVTFDDLPTVSVAAEGVGADRAMTEKLVTAIRESGAPAIGFVNEGKLASAGGPPEDARVGLLERWLEAGLDLGNHTYSHPDLHRIPLADYESEVVRGDEVTRRLLTARGKRPRYFRHPFLHTGQDLATKAGLEKFLAARGYAVAPVTHDNSDWIFARAYASAARRGDRAQAGRIAAAYVPYMEAKFDYFERQSRRLFSREIPQVLLLHANSLNADTFGALAAMMKRRGYVFVSLDDALADEAYDSTDTYTGPSGITWLHRWALSRGDKDLIVPEEPRTPPFVLEEAGIASE